MGRGIRGILIALVFALLSFGMISCGSGTAQSNQPGTGADSATPAASTTGSVSSSSKMNPSTQAQAGLPDADQIKADLIGKSINDPHLGGWDFEDPSEFVSFTVVSQKESGGRAELMIDMRLKDIHDGREYNGQATVVYTNAGGRWSFSSVSGTYRSAAPSV